MFFILIYKLAFLLDYGLRFAMRIALLKNYMGKLIKGFFYIGKVMKV
jgi:hypothetical protein